MTMRTTKYLFGAALAAALGVAVPSMADAASTLTTLYSFTGGSDGAIPTAGLIFDASGAIYGTTFDGGTVFKLTAPTTTGGTWSEIVLTRFGGGGALPRGGLISDASGALYGTTSQGGAYYYGTVFMLEPPATPGAAWGQTVLHNFTGGSDGLFPFAGLISDASGALYGTTIYGGGGSGTVFKLAPPAAPGGAWSETVLYGFTGGSDGAEPFSALIADASGALYGTTEYGGASGVGTVFRLAPPATTRGTWTKSVLYIFTGGNDGGLPNAGLIPDESGTLYGTTEYGGAKGYGTVFKLTVPATFFGVPGLANCAGQSISFLAKKYGGIAHATAALGYTDVKDLQNAVAAYCGG
jgi:uncharacterized repeat protein (TIGR03803 family)